MDAVNTSSKGLLNSLTKAKIRTYKKAVQEINKTLTKHCADDRIVWLNENYHSSTHPIFLILQPVSDSQYNDLPSWQQVHLMDSEGTSTYYKKLAGFNQLDPVFEYFSNLG